MVHAPPEPYQPHQRAVLCNDDPTTGGTVGYHCTITAVHTSSVDRYPNSPDRWVYRVFVPYFNKHVDVSSCDLFVTGRIDSSDLPPDPIDCKIHFDSHVEEDNDTIEGRILFPDREWVHFVFRKCDQPISNFQFRMPVNRVGPGISDLCYKVPMTERLDRRFVLVALAEIVGIEE